jgi:hypothetical protein
MGDQNNRTMKNDDFRAMLTRGGRGGFNNNAGPQGNW